ncbi:MAG TPA: HD domain-containing protein [Vicinamibacteria bacterium]|nr:HD domain-containing protein [Vicinamibacteria bacterium]
MPRNLEWRPLSAKFALALQFANEIHSTQVRKGQGVPYVSHLMAVSALVLEYGGDETQAIAALLHDSAEDCGGKPMLETVRLLFGADVAAIVESCTDTFQKPKPPWRPRKRAYLKKLATKPACAKLVACADKLHNLSNTLRDIRADGAAPWKKRMAKTPNGAAEKQIWYYRGCLKGLSSGWQSPIVDEFGREVVELCQLIGTANDVEQAAAIAGKRL